jgi:SEC-C motif-containing protein
MRSRYAAYALGLADYIITTTHPKNPARKASLPLWRRELLAFSRGTKFKGLSILEFSDGESEAYVSFTAYLEQAGKDASFSERSRFLKEKGKWLYESGNVQKFLV